MWQYYVTEFIVLFVITLITSIIRRSAVEKLPTSADIKNAVERICTATEFSVFLIIIGYLSVQIAFGKI